MRLLDLFCGAGGCAKGYQRAGFYTVGVDIKPQKHYCGDKFVQADALEYCAEHGHEYDAIHASPPCQGYSIMNNLPWLRGKEYPLLILPMREMLTGLGKPYVIENVYGARYGAKGLEKRGLTAHGMQAGWLCGTMFGQRFYRHRLFETSFFWMQPAHPKHTLNLHPRAERWVYGGTIKGLPGGMAGMDAKPRRGINDGSCQGYGHQKGSKAAAEAMGIDWMIGNELSQAIPPAYTEYIGAWLMKELARHEPEKEEG